VELVRSKAGSICGDLVNILMTLKGLPLGYNRDLQDTKPPVINVAKEISAALKVMTVAIENLTVNKNNVLASASDPQMIATDLVEYLVSKGVPFRQAHECVAELASSQTPLSNVPLSQLQKIAKEFDYDVFDLFEPSASAHSKTSHGGTGSKQVISALMGAVGAMPCIAHSKEIDS